MIIGADKVVVKFAAMTPRVVAAVTREISLQSLGLVGAIKRDYMSGQMLNRRTGALSRSINATPVRETGGSISSSIGSSLTVPKLDGSRVPLLAVHEFGAVITAKRAKYLRFKIDGHWVMTKSVTIPARPVLTTAMEANRPKITEGIRLAVRRAVNEP